MKYIIFAVLLLFAVPALAQTVSVQDFCKILPDYKEPMGVEYTPGVAADGHFVAPADLPGQKKLRDFETIEIPVDVNLVKQFNLTVPPGTQLKPDVALISIHKDGHVDYNDQDISDQAYQLCNKGKK